jgi:hypothetical protein
MKFIEILQDDNGKLSATRLAFLLWSFGVFTIWTYLSVATQTLMVIPITVVELTGVFILSKVTSAWVENFSINFGLKKKKEVIVKKVKVKKKFSNNLN